MATILSDDDHHQNATALGVGQPCPRQLEWSAFGADYMDTACVEGTLYDLDCDAGGFGEIPCPFCRPADFIDYYVDGTTIAPTCTVCQQPLPSRTAIAYHDGKSLRASATCPTCGPRLVELREYDERSQWEPQRETARA